MDAAEFRTCPACGYGRGFHVFFRKDGPAVGIGLICPSCGQSYDLGWSSREVAGAEARPGPVFDSRS
ncbi:MAG: hypothetical protein Kow0092_34990 [Deferrisomatales bacterium]